MAKSPFSKEESFAVPSIKLCFPVILYILLCIIDTVAWVDQVSALSIFVKILFHFIFGLFLNYLCVSGYTSISWFLVFMPFVLILIFFFIAISINQQSASKQTTNSSANK
jgi:uncharacterized membrane protein